MPSIKINKSNNLKPTKQTISINKKPAIQKSPVEQPKEQIMTELPSEAEKFAKARREMEEALSTTLLEDDQSIEITEEDLIAQRKRNKQIKRKKIILFSTIIITLLSLVGFGVINTFFQEEITPQEIASISNEYNGRTNFPVDGVYGYLQLNIDTLLGANLSVTPGVKTFAVKGTTVTRINTKSDDMANVYFYTTIVSNNDSEYNVNCVLPLYFDKDNNIYQPSGRVIFTPNASTAHDSDEVTNPLLSFDGISEKDESEIKKIKPFVDNFFTMLYSNQSIDPYYNGSAALDGENLKFVNMNTFIVYNDTNRNGYNAYAEIVLETPNGLSYTTQKYLVVEKSGDSWMIKAVL